MRRDDKSILKVHRRQDALILAFSTLAIALAFYVGCTPSQRQTTIKTTLATVDASAAAFVAYDKTHQTQIVANATDKPSGESALGDWRKKQTTVGLTIAGAYRAVAIAATLEDDQSLQSMAQAALILAQELRDLGVVP
jgi:hypothetical protein